MKELVSVDRGSFAVCRLRLSATTSDLTIPIESAMIKSVIMIWKHLALSTCIALLVWTLRAYISDVGKLRCSQLSPIAD